MTRTAKTYAGSVIALGSLLPILYLIADWRLPELSRFMLVLALTGVAATLRVKLPAIKGSISITFVFILIGLTTLTLSETLIIACLATLLQCVSKPKTSPRLIQVLFNMATVALSTIIAFHVPQFFGQQQDQLIALVLRASVFFIVNGVLVSTVIALVEHKPVIGVWRQFYLWAFPYYLIGAGLAGTFTASSHSVGWSVSLFILPLMYLIYLHYRLVLANFQAPRSEALGV